MRPAERQIRVYISHGKNLGMTSMSKLVSLPRCSRPSGGLDFLFVLVRIFPGFVRPAIGGPWFDAAFESSSSGFRFSRWFKFIGFKFRIIVPVSLALLAGCAFVTAQTKPVKTASPSAVVERGKSLFGQNCAFCHGREGFGGESGPNLIDSDLVASDVRGNKIGPVVRNGRRETGMPAFKLSLQEITALSAFLHAQKQKADSHPGGPARCVGGRPSNRQCRGRQRIFQWRGDLLVLPFSHWRPGRRGHALSRAGA